jgi:Rps23 Pro-64 3,4-dihydroxylase Tpa1-like proline 4-hydroxylase
MEEIADVVSEVSGLSPEGAKTYSVRSYLYPQAVSLNWHSDARKGGAFTFYYHERWHRKWGGELLVASPELHPAAGAEGQAGRELPEPSEDDDGYMLRPLSNRLVIVRAGTAHKIAPVSRAAGSHVRRSLTGFFATEDDTG